jgi:hypothetical protein
MKIIEGMINELHPSFGIKYEAYCEKCYTSLTWESHNSCDIQNQYWIAFCKCNNGQRMWTMNIETVKFTSINDK